VKPANKNYPPDPLFDKNSRKVKSGKPAGNKQCSTKYNFQSSDNKKKRVGPIQHVM
jgi:hypothetical protein